MSKFKKKKAGGPPAVNTSALPDIVFMLLFFFMVSTVMKEDDLKVKNELPKATEINKLERRSLVSFIYIGVPKKTVQGKKITEPMLQLNGDIQDVSSIKSFVLQEREARLESEVPLMTTSIKADKSVKMGLITDVKQELRKVQAYKISYASMRGEVTNN